VLPLVALLGIPAFLTWLAAMNGPFVVAMVLFSPVASLLMVVAMTLMLAAGAGLKRHIADSVAWMRRRRLCAACGYDLAGVEASVEEVTTCPECGAAWRLNFDQMPAVVIVRRSEWNSANVPVDSQVGVAGPLGSVKGVGGGADE
jgi:hypothetical protein